MIKLKKNILFKKAVAVTGCFFIISCSNNYQEVQDLAKKKTPIDTAINVESYLSQDGLVKAKLTAPLMTTIIVSDTPKTEFPHSLHVDFYNDSTKVQSRLFSKYGLYYNNKLLKYNIFILNNVK